MIVQSAYPEVEGHGYRVALCNALQFWGLSRPWPGTEAWDLLMELGETPGELERFLGIVAVPLFRLSWVKDCDRFPVILGIHDPKLGDHFVLLTGRNAELGQVSVVNFEGEPQRWVDEDSLQLMSAGRLAQFVWAVPEYRLMRRAVAGRTWCAWRARET
jgi:hypothetical protein